MDSSSVYHASAPSSSVQKFTTVDLIDACYGNNGGKIDDKASAQVEKIVCAGFTGDINAYPTGWTLTPLMQAGMTGTSSMVKILIRAGANVNLRLAGSGIDFIDALQVAAIFGNHEVITELVNAGANVFQATSLGRNALHLAAQYGHHRAVSVLVNLYGAHIDLLDVTHKSALRLACFIGETECAQVLVAAGANPFSILGFDRTSIECARLMGHHSTALVIESMLPSREVALGHLADIAEATGLIPDLADVVVYHLCVYSEEHDGLANEYLEYGRAA